MKSPDLAGKTFGMLVVVERAGSSSEGKTLWRCACLGCHGANERLVTTSELNGGKATRCRSCAEVFRTERLALLHWTTAPDTYRNRSLLASRAGRVIAADARGTPRCNHPKGVAGNRLCARCRGRWQTFRITPDCFEELLEAQAGLCGICTKPMNPSKFTHIDHDHETRRVRMLLCNNCNSMVGHCHEDALVLWSGAAYIQLFKAAA